VSADDDQQVLLTGPQAGSVESDLQLVSNALADFQAQLPRLARIVDSVRARLAERAA